MVNCTFVSCYKDHFLEWKRKLVLKGKKDKNKRPGDRKSGIPALVEMPAPTIVTTFLKHPRFHASTTPWTFTVVRT